MTQNDRVLRHLKEVGPITPLQAMESLGIMRLASRIHDLKWLGYQIVTSRVTTKNRWGERVSYSKYTLEEGI